MTPASVTLFGAAHIDRQLHLLEPAIPGASNRATMRETGGGTAFNIARNLAGLGLGVTLATRIGRDAAGDQVGAMAAASHVTLIDGARSAVSPTACYHAVIDTDGSLTIGLAAIGIYEELTPEAVTGVMERPADFWVADANLPVETLAFLLDRSAAGGPPLAIAAVAPDLARRLRPLLGRIDMLLASHSEALSILDVVSGTEEPSALAQELRRRGVRRGFVSDGPNPFPVWHGDRLRMVTPLPARIASVSGAGDALSAGTILGLTADRNLFDAIAFGIAAAALKIESDEPVRPDLTYERLQARLTPSKEKTP